MYWKLWSGRPRNPKTIIGTHSPRDQSETTILPYSRNRFYLVEKKRFLKSRRIRRTKIKKQIPKSTFKTVDTFKHKNQMTEVIQIQSYILRFPFGSIDQWYNMKSRILRTGQSVEENIESFYRIQTKCILQVIRININRTTTPFIQMKQKTFVFSLIF